MRRVVLLLAGLVAVSACSGATSIPTETPTVTSVSTDTTTVTLIPTETTARVTSVSPETTTFAVEFEDQGPFEVTRPLGCDAEPGSAIDLESEPAFWLAFGHYRRWTDSYGCPVRVDVISHTHLPEHCDWEAAEVITVGGVLGESFEDIETSRRFVWNRDGVIPGFVAGEVLPLASLPDSARDTGYRQGQAELWVDDNVPAVLLVVSDSIRVFRFDQMVGICS